MTHRSTLFGLASLTTALALAGCGGDEPADEEGGTGSSDTTADSSPTDPSMTDPSNASQSMTDASSATESSDGNQTDPDTSTGGTTSDPDTGTTGDTTTGVPECPYPAVDGMPAFALQVVATGFDRPVLALGHPTQPDRLFVVEQGGDIKILEPGEDQAPDAVFLHVDVAGAGNSSIGDERGLLGFAFHPDFPNDPRVYVAYTADLGEQSPPVTVSEFLLMRGDDSQVDPESERVVIEYDKPSSNHNGGMIGFGPDGYLYIGTGDGGAGSDFYNTGQDPDVILAKLLRIDVEPDGVEDSPVACGDCNQLGPFDYTIPDDNPFADGAGATPEVYAWGFRNPWRFSWDLETDDLWLGDVGQFEYEEIDIVSSGQNYGWSGMEGNHCFNDFGCDDNAAPNTANSDGLIAPIFDYVHGGGRCSITGGTVYRSCEVPGWSGIYTYGDYCTGELFALTFDGADVQDLGEALDLQGQVLTGNGWNAWGDSYFTAIEGFPGGPIGDGLVYRLAPE